MDEERSKLVREDGVIRRQADVYVSVCVCVCVSIPIVRENGGVDENEKDKKGQTRNG